MTCIICGKETEHGFQANIASIGSGSSSGQGIEICEECNVVLNVQENIRDLFDKLYKMSNSMNRNRKIK